MEAMARVLADRPDLILIIMLSLFLVSLLLLLAIAGLSTGIQKRRFIHDIFQSASVQERMKDPQVDFVAVLDNIMRSVNEPVRPVEQLGMFAKMNQDITWDVSGLIGLIVTFVLMAMVVTRTYKDVPSEVFAGWATILGFYFGKAAK